MSKFIKHGDIRINLDKILSYESYNLTDIESGEIVVISHDIVFKIDPEFGSNSIYLSIRTEQERDEFLAKIDKLVGVENE